MDKTSIIQRGNVVSTALVATAIFAGMPAQAQVTIFSENFNPLSAFGIVQDGYTYGDTTSSSSGIVAGAGLGGTTPGWQTVDTAASSFDGFSGVGGQYQNVAVTTATNPNLSDYVLSFYARESSTGGNVPDLTITVQTWTQESFGGTMTGTLSAGANGIGTLSLNPGYTFYSLNLGNTSVFQTETAGFSPIGGTYQIAMQLNGSGAAPYTDTLDVDDLQLTLVPEPSSSALWGLGAVTGLLFLRSRKARSLC